MWFNVLSAGILKAESMLKIEKEQLIKERNRYQIRTAETTQSAETQKDLGANDLFF